MNIVDSKEMIEEIIDNNLMVLAYFGSKTCGVCTDMKPKINQMLKKYPKIKFIYIDMEKSAQIGIEYGLFTIPAIILFVEGKESIREVRHISIQDIDGKISRLYDLAFE